MFIFTGKLIKEHHFALLLIFRINLAVQKNEQPLEEQAAFAI